MHLYVFIRAIKSDLDRLISDLEAQYFNYTFKSPLGEKIKGQIQFSVRPWGGMYELVFPEECLNEVLSMLYPFAKYGTKFEIGLMFIRKCLGLKKVKNFTLMPQRTTWRTTHQDIRIILIGSKKDAYIDGIEQL